MTSLYTVAGEQRNLKTRQAAEFMQTTFPLYMADRQREFDLLAESDLDWTYVRLPYVVEEPARGDVEAHLDYLPGPQITAEDLARFLIAQLDDASPYHRLAPFVANA